MRLTVLMAAGEQRCSESSILSAIGPVFSPDKPVERRKVTASAIDYVAYYYFAYCWPGSE